MLNQNKPDVPPIIGSKVNVGIGVCGGASYRQTSLSIQEHRRQFNRCYYAYALLIEIRNRHYKPNNFLKQSPELITLGE